MKITKEIFANAAANVTVKHVTGFSRSGDASGKLLLYTAMMDRLHMSCIGKHLFPGDTAEVSEVDVTRDEFKTIAVKAIKERMDENEADTERSPIAKLSENLSAITFVSDIEEELFGEEADAPAETEGDADD